jgi:hypothetical protein
MFVVHREPEGKPDMEFRMHESGLHYFDPRDSEFIFVNTVSENKAGFTKRQIKEAEVARSLYSKLNYPSWKDFKWIIRSNQIKDCPVTVDHVDTALKIWGKNVAALKGKTTRTKPDPVARDTLCSMRSRLDSILHGSPRIPSSGQYFVPGQQECNSFGEEWKSFEQQGTKHVNIQYFFITDPVDKGDVVGKEMPISRIVVVLLD